MIITQHNDNGRSGANLAETVLKPANVKRTSFGKLFEIPVIGAVYAQPLFVPDLRVPDVVRNVLFVATMHNQVSAFDADNSRLLWQRTLAQSIQLPDPRIGPSGYLDIEWEVGVLSTPVVDTDRNAIYLVSTSWEPPDTIIHQLWMLDLATGHNLRPPTTISGSVGSVTFHSYKQIQRAALLLSSNQVYVAFASYGDSHKPYHGWVFSFDAATLAPLHTFCSSPQPEGDEGEGGIWQAGQGPATDHAGNLYFMTGNGDFDPNKGNFGDSVLKLDSNLNFVDYFSPHNNAWLDANDKDLGSAGILVIPGTKFIIGGGKEAYFYLMDMNRLGAWDANTDNVVQKFSASNNDGTHHIHGSPVFWEGPDGPRIYVWPEYDQCKAFGFLGNSFISDPVATSTVTDPNRTPGGTKGMPGGFLSISAAGGKDGILWASHPWSDDLNQEIGAGVLRAFDARTLAQTWSSRENRSRDDYGNIAKFCPPTIARGKVYMATMGGLSHKVPFDGTAQGGPVETAQGGPAMINRNGHDLVLGWSGTEDPSYLNVLVSSDGILWGDKVTIPNESTPNALSLAFDGASNRTFIAWTGIDDGNSLNVMSTQDATLHNWSNKVTLDAQSNSGPALHFVNGRLYIAWTGTDARLNIQSSGDLGVTWQNKRTLDESSPTEPALAFWNGNLILLWSGTDNHLNFIRSSDGGRTWSNKITLTDTSSHHPAMAVANDIPFFSWVGTDESLNLIHSESGNTNGFQASPNYKRVFWRDTAINGPCLCEFQGKIFIGWTGTDSANSVNVAQLSRGRVAVYGNLP